MSTMTADLIIAIAYVAVLAVCTYLTLFHILPAFWRWLLFPEDWSEPEPLPPEGSVAYQMLAIQRDVNVAQAAIGRAILPVFERTAAELARVLGRDEPPEWRTRLTARDDTGAVLGGGPA